MLAKQSIGRHENDKMLHIVTGFDAALAYAGLSLDFSQSRVARPLKVA